MIRDMRDSRKLTAFTTSGAAKTEATGEAPPAPGLSLGRRLATVLLLAAAVGFGGSARSRPAEAAEPAGPGSALVSVTASGHDAWAAFYALQRQGGPKVLMPGGLEWLPDR